MQVGFIGLGRMGRPMAENLLKADHTLTVHNRSQAAVEALTAMGAQCAGSPADVAERSELLFTCLMTPEQVEDVYLGERGVLRKAGAGLICVDSSTIDPMTTKRVGAALVGCGVDFLDAPVSGGPKGAAAASLTMMIGGDPLVFSRAKPVLEAVASKLFHLGPIGSGTTAKICNQILTGVTHVLVSEVMVLGTKAGMDPQALYDVLRVSSGQSNSLERAVPNFILPRNFEPAFAMDGISKDLECAAQTAKELGVRQLLLSIAQQCYIEARGLGFGQQDVASVIRPMEAIAHVEVSERK